MIPYFMVNEETLKRTPPEVLTYLRFLRRRIQELEATDPQRRIEELEATNRQLQTEVEDLKGVLQQQQQQLLQVQQQLANACARLGTNSTNSSLPPSTDRFHRKRRPPPTANQPRKKSGGQPGHPPQLRLLVPPEQVRRHIPCKPTTCRRCGQPLTGNDPHPLRHQVAELPVVVPDVLEYQLHRLTCSCCHTSTCGPLPAGIRGQFGPRLEATLALLAGQYRLGLRPVVALAADLWGLDISTGMVSKLRQRTAEALALPWAQIAMYVRTKNVNIDETHWRAAKKRAYLWAVVTRSAALFHIAKNRTAQIAEKLPVID
jgi:transposase